MSIHFTFESGPQRHVLVLGSADTSVWFLFENQPLLADLQWEVETTCTRDHLLTNARSMLADVRAQWEFLPYRYGYEVRIMGRDDLKSTGSGGTHGFKIGGRIHSIDAGAGHCLLSEWGEGPDGQGVVVRKRDVRGDRRIDTDDWGPIKISRRELDVRLPQTLETLIAYLESVGDEPVRVRRTDGPASLMSLVRRAADGDESAEEELFERGESAKSELSAKAADPKARKHHRTIAWLLLTVFPSSESRAAVEKMVEQERDEDRRNQYLTLLAATPR